MTKKYHIGENGPSLCKAVKQDCPYGKDSPHYSDIKEAQTDYEGILTREQGGSFASTQTKSTVELMGSIGNITVEDGNLYEPATRTALITGLCGDLAQAVRKKTGGDIYFVCYDYGEDDNEKFVNEIDEDPDKIFDTTTHVMIESPTKPGTYVDAYGQRNLSDIQEFYGDEITVLKGNQKMLDSYSTGNAERLGNFADAALDLDKESKGFSYLTSYDT